MGYLVIYPLFFALVFHECLFSNKRTFFMTLQQFVLSCIAVYQIVSLQKDYSLFVTISVVNAPFSGRHCEASQYLDVLGGALVRGTGVCKP